MTQQEIFNGMSKGEWDLPYPIHYREVGKFNSDITISCNGLKCADSVGKTEDVTNANALAITTAVNGTWGKGIDPECVEEMYECIRALHDTLLENKGFSKTTKSLQELLTRAKLK